MLLAGFQRSRDLEGRREEYHSLVVCPRNSKNKWKKKKAETSRKPTTQVSAMKAKPWPSPSPPRNTPLMLGLTFKKRKAFQQMFPSMKYWPSRCSAFHQVDHAAFCCSASSGASTSTSREMQLQQHLQELKERERRAQEHNMQLLLQFERAQETLKEMLSCNAAMKTIRMEYERYLEENLHRWQQQLQEKIEASHKKRMEDSLKFYLQHSKNQVSTATVDEALISQDPSRKAPKVDASQTFPTKGSAAYSRDRSSCYPHQESSWLTRAGMPPGLLQTPFQSQSPSPFPPPNFPYPHPHLLQHLTSPFDHHQLWVRSEAAGCPPGGHPCSDGIAVGSAGQLHTEEPPASSASQIKERENETSAVNSKRVRGGGGGRCLSSELDIKPVRLSSGHVESSESGRDSSLTSREKKKREKKGRTEASSSESERSGSQRSSRTSSEVVAASCAVALDSETNCSSEEGGTARRRRSERGVGVNTGSPPSGKEAEELSRSEEEEQTDSLSEKTRSPAQDDKSGSWRGDDDLARSENRGDEEVYSSEQSIAKEKDEEEGKKIQGCRDEDEKEVKSEESGEVEEDDEESNDEVPPNRNQKEDKDVEEDEDESEKLENEDRDDGEKESDSSQGDDEEEREGSERIEEEEESNEEEGPLRSEEAGDSEDSIICLQENRSKQMKNIPEEAAEDEEEESDTQSSNNKSKEPSDGEDIEDLLAPQEPINKKQNAVETEEKPKATCLNLGIFQVTEDGAKTGRKSDSDESDHFYD
ncbi:nucleoprotein TPR-like [Poeciliopsis prolifica]|uniref:nucleoprotein TPR-like n=1 Tax=Poeciliopsis prolifica TaxID=188132 RepID=UPI0024135CFD|nr:nucleoprotein TPR-like [Poeciliopsis prolifica]